MLSRKELDRLETLAREARINTLKAIASFGVGHVGGSLSIIEALVSLYYHEMKVNPAEPAWPDRDRFVLSKGHSGPGLYALLAMKGYFPLEELQALNKPGTRLPSHCDMRKTPGVDMTAGSLAQGISAAVGMAMALRLDGRKSRVFCIVGDGEMQEGQVWEAAMLAAQQRLDNLVVLIDDNGMQVDGDTDSINSVRPIDAKWKSFRWEVLSVDGHDISAICNALYHARTVKEKPVALYMRTVKAHGIAEAGSFATHNMPVSQESYQNYVKVLEGENHA